MQSLGEAMNKALEGFFSNDHIPADPGDYIGEDGLLHCGKWKKSLEIPKKKPASPLVPSI